MDIIILSPDAWLSYKQLLLRALKEDPQAFGVNYQTNLAYPDEEWHRRLVSASKGESDWLLFARENSKLVGMISAYLRKNTI
jgi:hypothetical protein